MRLPRIEAGPFLVEAGLPGCSLSRIEAAAQVRLYNACMPAMQRLCSAILLLLPLSAFAQVNATSDYLARMDTNGDGRVDQAEYLDWMSYAFDARDGNRDGVLTPDELPGGKGQALTRVQHRERLAATFVKQDVNRDGHLSARELAAPPQ